MTRKEHRQKNDFIKGYKKGYQWKELHYTNIQSKSRYFKRGYYEARRDFIEGEPPIY